MSYGCITEGFSILPSLNINWMHVSESYDSKKVKKIYDIELASSLRNLDTKYGRRR